MEFIVNCYNKIDLKLSWEGKMMKTIRKTAIVMLLCVYFLTYGVLPQVEAGKDTPVIVVAHRAGAKVAPENTLAALEQAIRDGAPIAEIDVQQLSDGTLIVMHDSNFKRTAGEDVCVWIQRQTCFLHWKWEVHFLQHTEENRSRHWKRCLPVPRTGSH